MKKAVMAVMVATALMTITFGTNSFAAPYDNPQQTLTRVVPSWGSEGFLVDGTHTNYCNSKLYELYPEDGEAHPMMSENFAIALMALHTGRKVTIVTDGCVGNRAVIISIYGRNQ